MLKVTNPLQIISQIEVSTSEQRETASSGDPYTSSISFAKSKSKGIGGVFRSCFSWIASFFGRILSGLKDALLKWTCLGECYEEEKNTKTPKEADWAQVKVTFTGIKEAVFPSAESKKDGKGRQTRFNQFYKDLSGTAKDLFHKHIGLALARQAGCDTANAQEEYVNKNWTDISKEFDRILTMIKDDFPWELKEAVESFEKEIQKR